MAFDDLISVVIPIYNVASYLQRCVSSVLAQTYEELDIILVDDGSDDGSGLLCDDFARNDSRIRVLHKQNGGLSDARNAGLAIARGSWIFFLDSDDYISPYCLSALYKAAIQSNAEIAECRFLAVANGDELKWPIPHARYRCYDRPQSLERFLDYDGTWIMAWNKLYKRDLFDGIRFPIGKLNEDEFTTPYLVLKATRYASISDPLYAYVQREGSIMHTPFSDAKLDGVRALLERLTRFAELGNDKINAINSYHLLSRCQSIEAEYGPCLDEEQSRMILSAMSQARGMKVTPAYGLTLFFKTQLLRRLPKLACRLKGNRV